MTDFRTLSLADALEVAGSMRALDWACVRAVIGNVGADIFAANRWQTEGPAWALVQDGRPVLMFGLSFSCAWSAVAWLVATPAVSHQSWRKLMRFAATVRANITDRTAPHFKARIEANVLAGWPEAEKFASRLGFAYEGTRKRAGSAGEDVEIWGLT